ncbi:hypothetical protein [Actinophytocola algeriensis]|uniref:Uncharacterized membrane protein YkvA (DUF1232 family) n=1 Tax=Actinophytocola algeriensis TaxID=1768010 RepID=A0A7W7VCX1_9PSEU|nr:hypothetical protein [Actinophytocola algeriensis]MBB4905474.1 uncharacterized membrane protein YkvA (DUF1232 family) [Actinophytocola algeriensis]MBE1472841.1 uncharacterized membrane protein YkvA (DUF1232 family) [Actinophytocola algeriensis]
MARVPGSARDRMPGRARPGEFLPVIGPLDDVVVVALVLRYAARGVPRDVLLEAWPGNPDLLQRLIGPARTPRGDH